MSVTTHPPHKPIPICTLLQDDDFCPVHHKGQCRRPEKTVHLPTFEDHDMNGDGDENGESQSESEEEDAVKKALIEPPATFDDTTPPALTLVYTPGGTLPRLSRYLYQLIEIRIPSKHLSVKNKEIATRQLWGTDIYTDDSDVVAILMHSGRMVIRMNPPTNNIGVVATFRVLPGQSNYISSTRFYCKSRPWVSPYTKCSLSVVKSEPMEDGIMWAKPKPAPLEVKTDAAESDKKRARSREIRLMRPTMGTITDPQRFMKSRRRFAADATLIFNTWNEPCFKYSLGLVGDRGMDENEWTSARLKKEVIYCENNHQNKRYELSREEDSDIHATAENGKKYDVYRWAEVMVPVNYQPVMDVEKVPSIQAITLPLTSTTTTSAPTSASKKRKSPSTPPPSVPLPPSSLKILESHVDWDNIEWGPTMVRIRGKEYIITTIQFKPITNTITTK